MKSIRVAIIGYGHLGKWHAEKAKELANLVAIVEKTPQAQEQAKKKFPEVKVVAELTEVMDEIDAAVIVTPTSTHVELLKDLLTQGKHIFCEKPLCSTIDEAHSIQNLYKNSDIVLQVGHSERFHESWDIIDRYQKYLTKNCVIRMNRFAPFKGRAIDVDVVQDLMIHDLDLLLYLFKEMPTSVRSSGHKIRTSNWDFVCSDFSFDSGIRAFLVASRNHVKEVRDMEVFSDSGCLYVDLFHNQIHVASDNETTTGEFVETLKFSKRDHLMIEQKHFYESILKSSPAIVTYEDGLKAVGLISKVLESLDTGKETKI